MEILGFPDADELSRYIALQRSLNYPVLVGAYYTVYLVPQNWSLAVLVDDPSVTKVKSLRELEAFLANPNIHTCLLSDHYISEASIGTALALSPFQKTVLADRLGPQVLPPDAEPSAEEAFRYSNFWAELMRKWSDDALNADRFPEPNEVCAVVHPSIAKSAALLYDRIYVPTTVGALAHDRYWEEPPPAQLTFGASGDVMETLTLSGDSPLERLRFVTRRLAEHYQKKGFSVVPGYHSSAGFERGIPAGEFPAYLAAFTNIPVVRDADISWEQVLEFRSDKDAKQSHREFREWLRFTLDARTVDEAKERIEIRLGKYERALHKHGMKTLNGAVTQVLDSRATILTAGTGILTSLAASAIWPALLGLLVIGTRATLGIIDAKIDHSMFRDGAPGVEVAYLYDVKQKFA